nr:MAG TPA: hypothetical protein [Caudoviricetes sp.]
MNTLHFLLDIISLLFYLTHFSNQHKKHSPKVKWTGKFMCC